MSARPEIDLGLLSPAERPAPVPYTAEERELDFTYFHLCRARDRRLEMARIEEGTREHLAKRIDRFAALETARFHLSNLRVWGVAITPEIESLAISEGALA